MLGQHGFAMPVKAAVGWNLFFAREPEPDLDFEETQEEDESLILGSQKKQPKKPRRSPVLYLLLGVLLVGILYLAMDPALVFDLIGLGPSIDSLQQPAPAASKPAPAVPASPMPATPPMASPAPAPQPSGVAPAVSVPTPLFAEGQRVSVLLDPASPAGAMLTADAAGMQPGPRIRPGSVLTVLDAEFHNNTWIYHLRTEDGLKGWASEQRLIARP